MIHNKTKFEHTKELSKPTSSLNLYKLNILGINVCMHRVHTKTSPSVFTGYFKRISNFHSAKSSVLNFSKPKPKPTKAKYIFNDVDMIWQYGKISLRIAWKVLENLLLLKIKWNLSYWNLILQQFLGKWPLSTCPN